MFSELNYVLIQLGVIAVFTPALLPILCPSFLFQLGVNTTWHWRGLTGGTMTLSYIYRWFVGQELMRGLSFRLCILMAAFRTGKRSVRRWRRCTWWFRTRWRALRATAPGEMLRWPPGNLPEPMPCWSERWRGGRGKSETRIRWGGRDRGRREEGIPHHLSMSSLAPHPPPLVIPVTH